MQADSERTPRKVMALAGGHGHGSGQHHQEGIDETDHGDIFTISIKVPADPVRTAVAEELEKASAAMKAAMPGTTVSFHLPIEYAKEDQIRIAWVSRP